MYNVGIGSGTCLIEAPSPVSAAMFYGLECVHTNNPFIAVIYEEDGVSWSGNMWWITFRPSYDHAMKVFGLCAEDLKRCRLVEPAP